MTQPTVCRGIRGATTAAANTAEDILEATQELVDVLIGLNHLKSEDIASAIFTTTPDLNAMFPAAAARMFGWTEVPMMCAHEMSVPGVGACEHHHEPIRNPARLPQGRQEIAAGMGRFR